MGFRKDFLWGGATAANQCEGGANEGNRGLANVDLMPLGKDRYLVGTGKMKMYDFDDQHFYPSYMCGNVVRSDVLKKHPELKKVLKKLSYKINDLQMAKMNDLVESKGKEPKEVAKSYLKKLKLLKE